ncbi:DNA internalization-related competence protein ComEC/Rec2 [Bacillus subtilis]|uniref:DNA internalization-related competence protein ComEC/Rec2 n=1 Tax=Bacillus subtilis TaxID=1423 RepID=UPI0009B4FF87|nr:DNA internalization-related competence protein ComEC/Rec2 [Bacillus subtilis]MCM3382734.1 DNA internalization-related competence protein ComEC/Rec2 [Bacillus subtilis]MEC2201901.1 DNA internalization-related competence protein ComEC/Rec2 [Bacillus subtilis]QAR97550.1 DNA internalization-related competence protein ComEC/Rec2 [Bacillus subtilis]TPF13411.1 DNA internalization-related competence protein ComEC/Rec2 [Bacillus subtilis]TXK63339.1 DNA internalization-related competence protein ComE
MMNSRLLLPMAAASATAGITAAAYFPAIFLFILFLLIILIKTRHAFLIIVCFFSFILFFVLYAVTDSQNVSSYRQGTYQFKAVIDTIPKIDGDRMSMVVKTPDKEKWAAAYRILSAGEKEQLLYIEPGMSCELTGTLEEPNHATVPGAFDYNEYLYRQHIHWNYSVTSIQNCSEPENFKYKVLSLRKHTISFTNSLLPPDSAGIVQALTVGDRFYVEDEVLTAYQKLGVVHLLAISGLHVGILTAGLFYIMIRLGITREKASILLLLFLPLYVMLTGAAPSVLRAALMSGVYLAGSLVKWRVHSATAICLSYIVLLLFNPYHLFEAGFQLSFAVSFSLILSSSIFQQVKTSLGQLTIVSLIAQLGSLPILLYHFHQFSIISVPMNMLMVPFYTFCILPGAVAGVLLLSLSASFGRLFFSWFDLLISWTNRLITNIADVDVFTIMIAHPAPVLLFLFTVAIILLLMAIEKRSLSQLMITGGICCTVMFLLFIYPCLSSEGEVDMIDIGQGDSMFVGAPHQRGRVLIDTGGTLSYSSEPWHEKQHPFSLGEKVLIPFLTAKGIKQLDALILTHADQDHIGEAETLLKHHKVKRLVIPKGFVSEPKDEKVLQTAREEGVTIEEVKRGDVLQIKDLQFHVLSPETPDPASKNNSSLVLWMETGVLSWILTGDLEKEGEQEVMDVFPNIKADVLKVGHHGSKGSTGEEFIQQLQPKTAIISAGKNNRYHHPHQKVLQLLQRHSIRVLRTDQNGTIQYRYKNRVGTFSVYPPYDTSDITETN